MISLELLPSRAEQIIGLDSEYIWLHRERAPMPQDEEWRILAEEAQLEQDPNKLLEIISALNRALDEQQKQTPHGGTTTRKRDRLKSTG